MALIHLGNYGGNPSRSPVEVPDKDAEFIEDTFKKFLKINSKHAWTIGQLEFIRNGLLDVLCEEKPLRELKPLIDIMSKVMDKLNKNDEQANGGT